MPVSHPGRGAAHQPSGGKKYNREFLLEKNLPHTLLGDLSLETLVVHSWLLVINTEIVGIILNINVFEYLDFVSVKGWKKLSEMSAKSENVYLMCQKVSPY